MTPLQSGRKLLIGGVAATVVVGSSLILSAAGTWTTKAAMSTARGQAAVAAIGGRLYVAGGLDVATAVTTLEVYDPGADSWTTKAPMPTARASASSGVILGKLYVAGGGSSAGCCSTYLEIYDPATNSWSGGSAMLASESGSSAASIDNKLYVVGGIFQPAPNNPRNGMLQVYDPSTNTWTTGATMPTPRAGASAAVIGGKMYVVGGTPTNTDFTGALEVYDPMTDSWTSKSPMPTPRTGLTVAAVNGLLYAIGGDAGGCCYMALTEVYHPLTDTWSTDTPMPAARTEIASGLIGGTLYVVGGYTPGFIPQGTNEAFTAVPTSEVLLTSLGYGRFWIGLKNSDDQGTRFDLRADVYKNATVVASALSRCMAGVTRNPNSALEAAVSFAPFAPVTYVSGDVFSLRVLTRIGTNANDTKCSGHNNAVGLRLYYDAAARLSRLGAQLSPNPLTDFFLHTLTTVDFLDTVMPAGTTPLFKDSAAVNFSGGNAWKEDGTDLDARDDIHSEELLEMGALLRTKTSTSLVFHRRSAKGASFTLLASPLDLGEPVYSRLTRSTLYT